MALEFTNSQIDQYRLTISSVLPQVGAILIALWNEYRKVILSGTLSHNRTFRRYDEQMPMGFGQPA